MRSSSASSIPSMFSAKKFSTQNSSEFSMSAINESLIREVVAEVLGRLGSSAPESVPGKESWDCGNGQSRSAGYASAGRGGKHGVFPDANEACAAAHAGFLQLRKKGVATRARVVEIVKEMAQRNAEPWGRFELEET